MTASTAVFSPTRAFWLIGIGSVAFAALIILEIFGDRIGGTGSFDQGPASVSAIGTRGFVRVFERLRVPVVEASEQAVELAGEEAVLVVTDPSRWNARTSFWRNELAKVRRAIVVLPKWSGPPNSLDERWIGPVEPVRSRAQGVLGIIDDDAELVHGPSAGQALGEAAGFTIELPEPQLIRSDAIQPLVAFENGTLIGEIEIAGEGGTTSVIVLSDPDLIANHNLDSGDNAVVAFSMVERMRPEGAALVFYRAPRRGADPSIWQRLFELPYVVVLIQALLAVAVLVWAGTGRFGSPRATPPPLGSGREQLIANSADLLDHARYGPAVLARYARHAFHDVAQILHAPKDLDDHALLAWLDRSAEARGRPGGAVALGNEIRRSTSAANATPRTLVRLALSLYRWKREMTDDAR